VSEIRCLRHFARQSSFGTLKWEEIYADLDYALRQIQELQGKAKNRLKACVLK